MRPRARLTALYALKATRAGHLSLRVGDTLLVKRAFGAWYEAQRERDGAVGLVPANHVRVSGSDGSDKQPRTDSAGAIVAPAISNAALAAVQQRPAPPYLEITAARGRRLPQRNSSVGKRRCRSAA